MDLRTRNVRAPQTLMYDTKAYHTSTSAFLNIVETILNVYYLYLAHIRASPIATIVGFASIIMTLSKTVLYWLQEYFCGGCAVGHNSMKDLLLLWVLPNGCAHHTYGYIL